MRLRPRRLGAVEGAVGGVDEGVLADAVAPHRGAARTTVTSTSPSRVSTAASADGGAADLLRHGPQHLGVAGAAPSTMNSSPPQRASVALGRHARGDDARDADEHVVADLVAVGVVDALEAVDVQQHDAERHGQGPLVARAELVAELPPVRQAGQGVLARGLLGHRAGASSAA